MFLQLWPVNSSISRHEGQYVKASTFIYQIIIFLFLIVLSKTINNIGKFHLYISTLMATFSTFSNLEEAIVKGSIKGTFKGLFSALCTSTVNVSSLNKFKPNNKAHIRTFT